MHCRKSLPNRRGWWPALVCAALCSQASISHAQSNTPDTALQANAAWQFNPKKLCPNLRLSEDWTGAVVVFRVGRTGIPSQASIKSPSNIEGLDAAAMSCVLKLRFQPATRLGDGEAIDSWQQIAWEWARHEPHGDSQAGAVTAPSVAAAPDTQATSAGQQIPQGKKGKVTIRVCSDDSGKLTQPPSVISSSGSPDLDKAAVKIAESGAPYYHPGTPIDGRSASGCARLAIEFETK